MFIDQCVCLDLMDHTCTSSSSTMHKHTLKTRIMLEHTSGGASMKRRRKGEGEKRRENKKEEKKGDR